MKKGQNLETTRESELYVLPIRTACHACHEFTAKFREFTARTPIHYTETQLENG